MALGLPANDTLKHVGQIGLRVEIAELRRVDRDARIDQLSAPPSLPLNNELRRPIAIGRIERSTVLLSTSTRPSRRTGSVHPND
jgi:hypothetical protein